MMQNQRQPFFKPLNTDHHTFEISAGKSQSINRQAHNTNEASKQDQDLAVNGERLNSLHAKLHQEADRIRKWKNQTELDLRQKDRKIEDSSHTIVSLRKSILDLQLQNESLSMTLQEEIGNRQEILEKVASTRNLCSVLKDHLAKTEAKVSDCEGEKTEVIYLEQEHKRQCESLSEKFKSLQVARDEEHSKLRNQISMVTEEREHLTEELKQKTHESETNLKFLHQQLDEKNTDIRDSRAQVEKNNEKIHNLTEAIDSLKLDLDNSKEQLENARIKNEDLRKQMNTMQIDKINLEQTLVTSETNVQQLTSQNTDLQSELNTSREEHTQQLQALQIELEDHNVQLGQKHKKLQFLQNDLDKTSSLLEDVKSSKDMLIMEKAELENTVHELERQNAELIAQHEQDCMALNQMSGSIQELQGQLVTSQQDGATLIIQLNEIRTQLSAVESEKCQLDERIRVFETDMVTKTAGISDLQRELAEKTEQIACLTQQIQLLQEHLSFEQCNHSKTQLELKTCHKELGHNQKELAIKMNELENLRKQLGNMGTTNDTLTHSLEEREQTETGLRENIEELQSKLTLLSENNENLLEEKQQTDEALHGKLLSKEKSASDLETKNKSLMSNITTKNKQMKELEKEIRSLKLKVTSGTKSLGGKDAKLSELQTDLETEIAIKTDLETKLQEQELNMNKLMEKLENAEKMAEEAKELADKCTAEKDQMFAHCEGQRSQMSSIMLGYKSDLETNHVKKDKEIETLKHKLETMKTKLMKETEDKVSKLNSDIQQLRKTISDSGYQMESLQKNFGEKEDKVQELEKRNIQKEEELRGLQHELEKMYIRSSTTSVAQTSPFPDKTYQKQPSSKIPTPKLPPRTPQITPSAITDDPKKTPAVPKTPQVLRTPSNLKKTPQRSILKLMSGNSATKKRRVVFASKYNDEDSESGESSSFEVMEIEDEHRQCTTPLILKHSPKPKTPDRKLCSVNKNSLPLSRAPRGPPVDIGKKKDTCKKSQKSKENEKMIDGNIDDEKVPPSNEKSKAKKDQPSSIRKTPNKSSGKFFKNSPKQRKDQKDKDMSWFESDDIFGFALED